MKRASVIGLGLSAAALLFATVRLPAQTRAAGAPLPTNAVLLTIEGRVETARRGAVAWTPAQTNQLLFFGDKVRTKEDSRATIRLANLSVVPVNELTTLEIRPPKSSGRPPILDLRSGSINFFNREKPGDTEFQTPLASGAIRGTEFNLTVGADGRTVLTLLDGVVSLAAGLGDLTLQSGEQGIVEPGLPPRKTAVLDTINVIQWSLYYPGVLVVAELGLTEAEQQALADSIAAYRSGDLLAALAAYPANRPAASNAERVFHAGLLLAAGQVEKAEALLPGTPATGPFVRALRKLIAAVKFQTVTNDAPPTTASEWLAESYYQQSRARLAPALMAAREATRYAPNFGFAWARVAELQFGFGRTEDTEEALVQALELSPRHAPALALKGFVLAAQNKFRDAETQFDRAITVDGALGNAWLGRGLCRIRLGDVAGGRADLQVAAAREPNRAVLRSYLGKAWSRDGNDALAEKELRLAKKLDPNDPTGWLYAALLDQRQNRVNEAVRELERSQELNDNRRVYRSKLLLDQDRAIRSANLAGIYQDAGMFDLSAREATRAVNADYGNFSAHLFLADSYDALRDPRRINLRYETPWLSELLIANLLAPVGAGNLSQNISQQEYARLFEGDHLGASSSTEYLSRGAWTERGSQYGVIGNSSYALDAGYRSDRGERPNQDFQEREFGLQFKQQLTPADSVLFSVGYSDAETGDLLQYYDPARANNTVRVRVPEQWTLFGGYHHEWAPGSHTLFLAGRLSDRLEATNGKAPVFILNQSAAGVVTNFFTPDLQFGDSYRSEFQVYSAELQQILQYDRHTLVVGARYQNGDVETADTLRRRPGSAFSVNFSNPAAASAPGAYLERINAYAYELWQIAEPLQFTVGLSYDRLSHPVNTDYAPLTDQETTKSRVSPKAGLLWRAGRNTTLRAAFTRSLGGLFYDNSVRLEPTQVAGFTQAFRSVIPESVVGPIAGAEFETWGIAVDHKFSKNTYVEVLGEVLNSDSTRSIGVFTFTGPLNIVLPPAALAAPGLTREHFDYREKSLTVSVNQLLNNEWALGGRYRISQADLDDTFPDVPVTASNRRDRDLTATLQQLNLYVLYNHPSGFFGQLDSVWTTQSNRGGPTNLRGDDFWQFNASVGWRFWRRQAEARLGLLNFTGQDYQLNPLNLHNELPRARTVAASFKFYF